MACSFATLHLFYHHFNHTNKLLKYLSDNAYTVYIIHPLVVVPITWTFLLILKAVYPDTPSIIWTSEQGADSSSCLTTPESRGYQDAILFAGFFYTVIASLVIVYPLASIIRSIPGAKNILG